MKPDKMKLSHMVNWNRVLTIGLFLTGIALLCVGVHNYTSIESAKAALEAANSGADPITAASAAGPADTQINWIITIGTNAIGVISVLLGILKAWQATEGQSVWDRIQAVSKEIPSPVLQDGDTIESLFEKLRQAFKHEAADKMASLAESVRKG